MSFALCTRKPLYRAKQDEPFIKTFLRDILLFTAIVMLLALILVEPALAGGTGGTGTVGGVSARATSVTSGLLQVVTVIGGAWLTCAWLWIAYQLTSGGKTVKDMAMPFIGSTVAGIAPIIVVWLFG